MEIKITPNYNTESYANISGNYAPFQNNGADSEIYSSVDIGLDKKVKITQTGGNIFFGVVTAVFPIPGTYFTTIKRTKGVMLLANQIISIDEVLESASYYLDGTIDILLNYKIFDLKELKRSTPFTKTIEVPFTENNDKIFTQIFNINVTDGYNPKKKSNCQITDDGVLIVSGYIQIQEIDLPNKLYKCIFYGEFKNLFDDMGDNLIYGNNDKVSDLDFTDTIHDKFKDEIEASWNNKKEFIYGLVDYEEGHFNIFPAAGPIPSSDLYPFVKAKYVFDKIFNKYGYTYESEFLNSNSFKNLLTLPSLFPALPAGTASSFLSWGWSASATQSFATASGPSYKHPPTGVTYSQIWKQGVINTFDQQIIDIYQPVFGPQYSGGRWRINFDTKQIIVNGRLTFDAPGPAGVAYGMQSEGYIELFARVYRGGSLIVPSVSINRTNERLFAVKPTGRSLLKIREMDISNITLKFPFKVGDEIEFFIQFGLDSLGFTSTGGPQINLNFDYYLETFDPLTNTTNYLQLSQSEYNQNLLPTFTGIKQSEFVSDIVKMFNLYIKQDKQNSKKFLIEPRDIFYEKGNIVDYLDYDVESANVSFLTDLAAKRYTLTYNKGEDKLNKSWQDSQPGRVYGDAIIKTDNDFLNNDKKIQLKAQPTIMTQLWAGSTNTSVPNNYYVPSLLPQSPLSTDQRNNGFGMRFLYYGGTSLLSKPLSYKLNTGLTSSITIQYNYFPLIDIFERYRVDSSNSLKFSNSDDSQFKENSLYYLHYENEIETYADPMSHILTIQVYMTTGLFSRINFNDKFYFEVNGNAQYYILINIENYNPSQPGMVKMQFLSYNIYKNTPKRDSYIDPGSVIDIGNGGVGQDLVGGGIDNIFIDNPYKYQVLGEGNIIDSDKKSVFVYGDNNNIKANNVVTYDSGATVSTSNTFFFGDYNPVLKDKSYLGVSASPGMIVYGGTASLYIRGIDNRWYTIDLKLVG